MNHTLSQVLEKKFWKEIKRNQKKSQAEFWEGCFILVA